METIHGDLSLRQQIRRHKVTNSVNDALSYVCIMQEIQNQRLLIFIQHVAQPDCPVSRGVELGVMVG